ncbi:MFS transporter [Chromohalobacter nigrandesensis]|uniref:MFS transporter n=1 Tax=Chromohalobacter nigrandesensis TaxID=119863 RepID=UPI001FF53731|nr:MFS transporter [Chromohalobacter nigrandesensis]MCK0746238.1 MFS transporter [Chromohalobacter nigrandesensis]
MSDTRLFRSLRFYNYRVWTIGALVSNIGTWMQRITQALLGLLALGLGLVTVTGVVTLWQVYAFALGLGCVTAFDAPARQTFVNDLVGDKHLSNAVALNSTSFNAARMIGPAIAGLLIAAVGWLANHAGPRWAMSVGASAGVIAALIGGIMLIQQRRQRLHLRPSEAYRQHEP